MTALDRATLQKVIAGVWVAGIFVLYLFQFKPIISTVLGRVIS